DKLVTGVQTCALPIWRDDPLRLVLRFLAELPEGVVADGGEAAGDVLRARGGEVPRQVEVLAAPPCLGEVGEDPGVVRHAGVALQIGRASCRERRGRSV